MRCFCMKTSLLAACMLLLAIQIIAYSLPVASMSVKAAEIQPQSGPEGQGEGQKIVVSLSKQWLYAYQGEKEVFTTAVMTGRPELPTPLGLYHILLKQHPTTFTSPWPEGSPNWYPPTYINYAMEFRPGGFFLHDTTWHSIYGPGTNTWHTDPEFGLQTGSHGCIGMPLDAAARLYQWAPLGTPVVVEP
ncbi:L,D-transpeptidase [Tengunoibacter tsumagoiensis]|uniref:L,D-TPase catalytic domain-containing protein n=1 Tax=Tengunoibacter tsumagoiensis TaxID=2014871 RepID=A0A401ZX65_9CHLR|nr:L,D-transpeptidase [Tengunoibacter tsumagoiensis]GCE11441.1 hypothetical protein KTT_13000 [Tengunoibacter tsumagoiensis]